MKRNLNAYREAVAALPTALSQHLCSAPSDDINADRVPRAVVKRGHEDLFVGTLALLHGDATRSLAGFGTYEKDGQVLVCVDQLAILLRR